MKSKLAICLLLASLPVRAGELAGRLTLNDRPLAGISVSAIPYETSLEEARREAKRGPPPEAIGKAVTNAKGEWRLVFEHKAGLPGKIVWLHYAGPAIAHGRIAGHWDTADSEDVGETPLRKGATLAGRVVDAAGNSVADAEVVHPSGIGAARTGVEGKFSLEGVGTEPTDLTVRKTGYATVRSIGLRAGSAARIVLPPGLSFSGVVLAGDGKSPVPGAVLRIDGRDAAAFAETDAGGRFHVHELGAGIAVVTADGGERGIREVTGVAVPQAPGSHITLVLAPAKTVVGRVLDAATSRPVEGALLDVSAGKSRVFARSGSDGVFTIRPAPAGDWKLSVSAPRYTRANRSIARAQRGDKPVEILLREGATITGRVTDDQRRPVAGAGVRAADSKDQTWSSGGLPSAVTSDDGTFTLRRVAALDRTRLTVTHPDFESFFLRDLALKSGETRTGVVIALRRGAALTGVVTAGDAPVAGARFFVSAGGAGRGAPPRSVAGPPWTWPRATTGADGRFRIGGLCPGEYRVTASKEGYASEARDIVVAEGRGPDPVSFALESEAAITGTIRGKRGTGIASLEVNAMTADGAFHGGGADRTLADGTFRIEGLKRGVSYNLFLFVGGGANTPRKTVTAPAAGVEIVVGGTGRIAGRVVDIDERPVPEFQVSAQTDRTSGGANWVNTVRQDVSSEAGEFVVENAPAGPLEVRVVAKGFRAARVGGILVEEGETRSGVEVRLARGATLRGRVVDARSGRPVPDAEISTDSAPSGATSDLDGAFSIDGVTPGKARVKAQSPDYAPANEAVEVAESGGSIELKLSPGSSLSAVVVSPGGEPVAGAEVTLAEPGRSWGGSKEIAGADGHARFSHIAPGRYSLTAGSAGRRSKSTEVALEADQDREGVRVVVGGGPTVLATVTGLTPDERGRLNVIVYGSGSYVDAKELPDGRFEARDVPPGRNQIRALLGGSGMPERIVSRPLTAPEDGTLEVELPFEAGFTLSVHVLRNGQGAEGADVYARPATSEDVTPGIAKTDASGSCRMTGLKAGTYSVFVSSFASSGRAPEQRIDLTGDRTLEVVIPAGRLTGRAVAAGTRQALANVYVSIRSTSADGSFTLTHDATTDDTGRFQLDGLEAGPLALTAQKRGYVIETRSVEADGVEELVIELGRGDGLDVTARDGLLGTPLGSLYVKVFEAGGGQLMETYVGLDGAGRGEIPSLKPGSYSIVAGANGFAPAVFDGVSAPGSGLVVSLTPGGTLDVEVAVERLRAGPLACRVTGRGAPLAWRQWGNRGELSLSSSTTHLTNFPPVAGVLACPGAAPVSFVVTEGGVARIALK